jgi:serine/threonine protein kinase
MRTVVQPKPKASYKKLYPRASSKARDLVQQLLQFTPGKRLGVQGALEHPYLANYHGPDPVTQKVQNEPVSSSIFDFQEVETLELSKLSLQNFIIKQLD